MRIFLIATFKQFFLVNLLLLLPLVIFGLLFSAMKKICYRNIKKSIGNLGTWFFGIIGVPIHEASHLFMCILFRHKVTEVSFFRPIKGRYDNILGFVKHRYNKNSAYQTAGCFFIGIAPMIIGSSIIVFIIHLIFPSIIDNLVSVQNFEDLQLRTLATTFYYNTRLILTTLFQLSNFTNIYFWISIYLIVSITLHMTISKADFDNALSGFALLEVIIFIIGLLNNIFGLKTTGMLNNVEYVSSILLGVLFIAAVMFGIVSVISYLIYRIFN